MKSGTGDDPFADDASSGDESAEASDPAPDASDASADADEANAEAAPQPSDGDASPDAGSDATASDAGADDSSADGSDADDAASDADGESSADAEAADGASADVNEGASDGAPEIPWVLRRSSVKADRPNVTQFFLRDETDRAERRFQSDVEDILDADVYTLDLREAAYLVAMRHPDEVAAELRDWGYEYLE